MKTLLDSLRGARHIGLIAAAVMLALLGLAITNAQVARPPEDAGSALEQRLARLLSRIDGAGRVSVMVTQDADGAVNGAVVVAEGLKNLRAALAMQDAVRTLLGVDLDHVTIIGGGSIYGGDAD